MGRGESAVRFPLALSVGGCVCSGMYIQSYIAQFEIEILLFLLYPGSSSFKHCESVNMILFSPSSAQTNFFFEGGGARIRRTYFGTFCGYFATSAEFARAEVKSRSKVDSLLSAGFFLY